MNQELTIIVGASRGIGLELCRAYGSESSTVVGTARKECTELSTLVDEAWLNVDVTSPSLEETLRSSLKQRTIKRLIISAGILESDGLDSPSSEAIRRQFEVNALGALRCAYELHSNIKPGGTLAFITSRMGSISDNTSGGYYGYRISKAALNAGAKSLALDLQSRAIKVAILHPGFVKTDMTNGQGFVDAPTSAAMLREQIDTWKIEETGHFRHANGEELPW
jgi:NAD(P)-dependent dehydrogenase (short-subunit alcohol dehydrogenase family)